MQRFKNFISRILSLEERVVLRTLLALVILFYLIDLVGDLSEHSSGLDLTFDFLFAAVAVSGIFLLGLFIRKNKSSAEHLRTSLVGIKSHLEVSQNRVKGREDQLNSLRQGLGSVIEKQFETWKLSMSEKEIALLLLKGLSVRDIAAIRNTSERTVRHQVLSIYSKSGVRGRAELAAFFLEDLLPPLDEQQIVPRYNSLSKYANPKNH